MQSIVPSVVGLLLAAVTPADFRRLFGHRNFTEIAECMVACAKQCRAKSEI
jgi:hypothetical protein